MKTTLRKFLLVVVLGLSGLTACVAGETNGPPALPRWEVGLFGLGSRLPYYRGSDEYRWYVFPVPYFIYRGDYIQADREGVRGLFYKGTWVETELSMSGNPPVRDGSGVREGMPELDPLIEMGPAIRLFLYRGKKLSALYLEAAARAVASIDMDNFSPGYEGERAALSVVLARFTPRAGSPWNAGLKSGVEFADNQYHSYFYDVEEACATPGRPVYHSGGGYSGATISGWLSRKLFDGVSISAFARLENCEGTVYEDSPLVRSKNNVTFGAALSWKIAESSTMVKRR